MGDIKGLYFSFYIGPSGRLTCRMDLRELKWVRELKSVAVEWRDGDLSGKNWSRGWRREGGFEKCLKTSLITLGCRRREKNWDDWVPNCGKLEGWQNHRLRENKEVYKVNGDTSYLCAFTPVTGYTVTDSSNYSTFEWALERDSWAPSSQCLITEVVLELGHSFLVWNSSIGYFGPKTIGLAKTSRIAL